LYRHVSLTIELSRIYLKDDSEQANLTAIESLLHTFNATSSSLFYVNAENHFKFCLSGTDFPITLGEERWRESLASRTLPDSVFSFSDWIPPGFDKTIQFWISAPLNMSCTERGYVFLGRDNEPWNENDKTAFLSAIDVVSELLEIRNARDLETISRRAAEKTLEANKHRMEVFFESSHDMIYTTDVNNRFTSINQAGLKLFGISKMEDVIGHKFTEYLKNEDTGEFFMKKILKDGYIADHEIILKRTDGTVVFCLETSHVIIGDDGNIVEIQGFVKDISDRIKNESELWKMNLELAQVNLKLQQTQALMVQHEKLASIGQLAAGVAHEINNPLGFLKSNQEMLRKFLTTIKMAYQTVMIAPNAELIKVSNELDLGYVFEECGKIFDESDEGFARIMRIVSNLMSFSRTNQNQEFDLYDVNAGIESTLVVAWNEIKYVAEIVKNLGEIPKIYARGGEVNQVILNILVNAAQAIAGQKRQEKGSINISTKFVNDHVVILISDDGPGIPGEIRSRIFDPFFTTKEPGKGTGLGLSISYDIIVTKHKGKISVESEVGKGTTFKIELPVEQSAHLLPES